MVALVGILVALLVLGAERSYANYEEYQKHQAAKLGTPSNQRWIAKFDRAAETMWLSHLRRIKRRELIGSPALCVGARLGGEVRVFNRLVSLAVGIDLNPGQHTPLVMFGDAHRLAFNNNSFATLYTNVLDHSAHKPHL